AQYSYGWVVPFLGAIVFWQRWRTRPSPEAQGPSALILLGAVGLLALVLPIRLFEEANPEWRLVLWAHAGAAVGLTLLGLAYTGGWPRVKPLAFAVAFPLIAVPLPILVEQCLIQSLARFVTFVTAEAVHLSGIPAFQHGNIIEISTGVVGVEEACSGIRSLQSGLLAALFLGELYRLSPVRRVGLVGLGVV